MSDQDQERYGNRPDVEAHRARENEEAPDEERTENPESDEVEAHKLTPRNR